MALKRSAIALLGACLALAFHAAVAQQPADRACAEDAKKFCSDVRPGGGRVVRCLGKHDAELAPACRERLAAGKARAQEFAKACKADSEKYCKSVQAGSGRVLRCLRGHEAELSAECKAQFEKARPQ
ncbi:MAG TPA: cysteine rich repeat-containing protein [Burkholderiales bacterium]|nr:cysteine rich repeat-containing protein [Burkholderiales bacterium]